MFAQPSQCGFGNDRAYICRQLARIADDQTLHRTNQHVDDLVSAICASIDHPSARQQTFNICMDEPVDYGELAKYLSTTRGYPTVEFSTPYFSTWLDNTKAKFLLGWRPAYDLAAGLRSTVQWYLSNEAWWRPLTETSGALVRLGLSRRKDSLADKRTNHRHPDADEAVGPIV